MLQKQLLRHLHKQVLHSLPKSAKPTMYLLTSAISATHQKGKQDGSGAMDTTATKIVAGFANHSWKIRIGFGAKSTASTRTNVSTATRLGRIMARSKVLKDSPMPQCSGVRSMMLPNWNVAFVSLNSPAQLAPGKSVKVRFASAESSSKAGIVTTHPTEGLAQPTVSAFFEVSYNRNKLALVTPLADGIVRTVHADVGQSVKKGDVLVEISSDEVAEAKAEFLTRQVDERIAELAYQREKKLKEEKISAARDFLEAEAAHEVAQLKSKMARQKLLNLGFSDGEIAQIAEEQDSSSTIKLRAPFAGTLVAREAVTGEAVSEGKALFKVTDLSTLWLDLSVSPEYADSVQVGQILTARLDGGAKDIKYTGVITWVDSAIDPRNRMLKARAEIQNPDGVIRQGMFGHAELVLTGAGNAVLLPRDAIQHHEGRPYVFVKEAPDLYALRHVSLGQSGNDTVAVTEGLGANELVVTEGAFIAMSEFLKSRLGAGCVDD